MYLALIAEKLMAVHVSMGRLDQGRELLRSWLERHPSLDLLDAVFRIELDNDGPEAA